MTDTRISTISKTYAKSLVDIASESDSFDYFKSQMEKCLDVLNSSEDLKIVMENSSISNIKKIDILNEIFMSKIDNKILNLLKLLVEKHRFNEFQSIYKAYCKMIDEKSNKTNVVIISAVDLNFEQKTNILFKLEHKLQCEVIPEWNTDSNIIAGLIFKFGDCVIDTSLRSKIKNLSKTISR